MYSFHLPFWVLSFSCFIFFFVSTNSNSSWMLEVAIIQCTTNMKFNQMRDRSGNLIKLKVQNSCSEVNSKKKSMRFLCIFDFICFSWILKKSKNVVQHSYRSIWAQSPSFFFRTLFNLSSIRSTFVHSFPL